MKPELTEKLLQRFEAAMVAVADENYDTGMAKAALFFSVLSTELEKIKTKEDFRRVFNSLPDPSFTEEKLLLSMFKYFPHLIRFGAKKLADSISKELPEPPGGRPSTDEQKKPLIVQYVGSRHTAGCSMSVAKKRAAGKFGISESTVQRIWDNRSQQSGTEADFQSVVSWVTDPKT